jgi:hypothetical protein
MKPMTALELVRNFDALPNDAVVPTKVTEILLNTSEWKRLAGLRDQIATAARDVTELERAHELAARLDRESSAASAASMRADQLEAFKSAMGACEETIGAVLEAAAAMASAYGKYSEATLSAQIAVPAGTVIPMMLVGPNGLYGHAFGPCERLILAELWRLGPERGDGIGRIVLPFAKSVSVLSTNHRALPPGIDEMRAANGAIVADIEAQVKKLNAEAVGASEVAA